jgi:hypothetical protein
LLPRLAVLSTRLTALHGHHLTSYAAFLDSLRSLARSNRALCPRTAELVEAREREGEGEVKDEAIQVDPRAIEAGVVAQPEEVIPEPAPAEKPAEVAVEPDKAEAATLTDSTPLLPDLSETLRTSLASLRADIAVQTTAIDANADGAPKQLMTSLEALSSYLSTQTFYATQSRFMGAATAAAGNYTLSHQNAPTAIPSQPGADAAAACRSEIRGLKGLLLNRCARRVLPACQLAFTLRTGATLPS